MKRIAAVPLRAPKGSDKSRLVYVIFAAIIAKIQLVHHTTAFSPPSLKPKAIVPSHAKRKRLPNQNDSPRLSSKIQSRFDELEEDNDPLFNFNTLMEETDLRGQLVELPVMFTNETEGQSFDMERWNTHRSSSRYLRLLSGIFFSVTTRRVLPTVLILVAWSGGIDLYNSVEGTYGLPELELPLTPFELTAPILGLLLVFRSDRAFDRFNVGSDYSWEITALFKSIVRELLSFTAASRFGSGERAAAYDLAEACVRLHGAIMVDHLRGRRIGSMTQAELFQLALGSAAAAGDKTENMHSHSMDQPLTPTAGVAAISLGITRRLPSLDFQESTLIESQFGDIVSSLGKCENILRTPIPLGYTRYSVRFLWIWLSLLPFALVNKFAEFGAQTWWEDKPQPVLVFAMLFIGFIFFSIEDIAVQIEEPFSVLPLELHQKWLIQDAKQIETMNLLVDGMEDEKQIVNGMARGQRTKRGMFGI